MVQLVNWANIWLSDKNWRNLLYLWIKVHPKINLNLIKLYFLFFKGPVHRTQPSCPALLNLGSLWLQHRSPPLPYLVPPLTAEGVLHLGPTWTHLRLQYLCPSPSLSHSWPASRVAWALPGQNKTVTLPLLTWLCVCIPTAHICSLKSFYIEKVLKQLNFIDGTSFHPRNNSVGWLLNSFK